MKYLSTRGGEERLSFEEAVLTGLAPNGGLYIPSTLPTLPETWQHDWAHLSFTDLALELYSLFIDPSEIPREDLKKLIEKSYSTFRHPDIAPLHRVGEKQWVLELFHGPTFAFKDVALQFLGNLFEYFLERKNVGKVGAERDSLTVVGATSGDTGSAAIYGLRSKKDISIFILHPKGRVSPIQEAQMTTVTDENVFNLAVEGTFDDCQDIVKALFSDVPFNSTYHLGAINSINWARILAQTVYYFSSYFNLRKTLPYELADSKIQFAVPTGNFGDILAGYYAKKLGLPMERLVVATNSNDILSRFWKTGIYEKADSGEQGYPEEVEGSQATDVVAGSSDGAQAVAHGGVAETLSPAMDILVSSNFERLLFYLALEGCTAHAVANDGEVDGGRAAKIRMAGLTVQTWMDTLKKEGRVVVPKLAVDAARRDMIADRTSDEQTTETIKQYFSKKDESGSYVADPHTAVGLSVANRVAAKNAEDVVQVVLSTAHPAKFNDAVSAALSSETSFDFKRDVLPKEFEGLLDKPRKVIDVKGSPEAVKEVVSREVEKLRGTVGAKSEMSPASTLVGASRARFASLVHDLDDVWVQLSPVLPPVKVSGGTVSFPITGVLPPNGYRFVEMQPIGSAEIIGTRKHRTTLRRLASHEIFAMEMVQASASYADARANLVYGFHSPEAPDGGAWVLTELFGRGETLATILATAPYNPWGRTATWLSEETLLEVLAQVANGLHGLHGAGASVYGVVGEGQEYAAGAIGFKAPELYNGQHLFETAQDCFALGSIGGWYVPFTYLIQKVQLIGVFQSGNIDFGSTVLATFLNGSGWSATSGAFLPPNTKTTA
ncbi:hypothetical protein MNV49_003550 [Pseudohyphozyma bogoriensis]|nr:hypothetical protein MNV49_003550 [Pseudohyphozyma bogoriensis]